MSNFIYDGTTLPTGKQDSRSLQVASQYGVVASEWNTVMQALLDVRGAIMLPPIEVKKAGAVGGGVVNDTARIQAAIDVAPAGSVVLFSPDTYLVDSLNLNGKRLTLLGYGATLVSSSVSGAISKTDHNNKLTVMGLRFTGTAQGIRYVTTTSSTQYDDFSLQDCRFENSDYGIYLDGAREGRIINCSFEGASNKGIYRVRTVNTDVIGGFWKNCVYGVNDDGDSTAFSAGLRLLGGTMIGCQYGVISSRTDFININGTVIDYCDNPIRILGVDTGIITGAYITTRTVNPTIYLDQYDASNLPREFRIIGNVVASNMDAVTSDAIVLKRLVSGLVQGNSVTFWWRYGIDFSNCTNLTVSNNALSADPASTAPTKYSVFESAGGDSSNAVRHNELNQPLSVLNARVENNVGFVTQNQGEGVSGSGVSSFTVAHGCAFTPAKNEVSLSPTNAEAAGKNPYISAVDATNITIGFSAATAAAAGVAWSVKRRA